MKIRPVFLSISALFAVGIFFTQSNAEESAPVAGKTIITHQINLQFMKYLCLCFYVLFTIFFSAFKPKGFGDGYELAASVEYDGFYGYLMEEEVRPCLE